MTVAEFCWHHTKVGELIVIRDSGYIRQCAWIDSEDIFMLSTSIATAIVKKDEWGELKITTEHGDKVSIPCHYVDI